MKISLVIVSTGFFFGGIFGIDLIKSGIVNHNENDLGFGIFLACIPILYFFFIKTILAIKENL